jgi:hypothetical protein
MVNVCGKEVQSVDEIVAICKERGDAVRGTYKARYFFGGRYDHNPYHGAALERPMSFMGNDPDAIYPWEQILVAAAQCGGSDYPMLAEYWGIPLQSVAIELEAVFDPRGEFSNLVPGFAGIKEQPNCYQSLKWKVTLASTAPKADLEKLNKRVLSHNMVLNALRAIPITTTLAIAPPAAVPAQMAGHRHA